MSRSSSRLSKRLLFLFSNLLVSSHAFSQIGPEHVLTDPILEYPRVMHVADLDGDGLEDIIAAGGDNYYGAATVMVWWRNTGNNEFTDMDTVAINTQQVSDIHAADLDGDEDIDIICTYNKYYCNPDSLMGEENRNSHIPPPPPPPVEGRLVWFENLGNGHFGPKNFIEDTIPIAASAYAADLNGDSLVDVLLGARSATEFDCHPDVGFAAWYENLGSGQFGARQLFSPLSDEFSVSVVRSADLDGDGDMDVVATQNRDGQVVWYENLGSGAFGTQQPIDSSLAFNCNLLEISDINNDHRPDLLLGEYGKVFWLQNDSASFSSVPQSIISTEVDYLKSIYPADLDNDGDIDAISASKFDSKVAWYPNLGQGIFGPQLVVDSVVRGANQVMSVNANTDGNLEIVSLDSYGDNEVSWYKNLGYWTFDRENIITPDLYRPLDFLSADIDSDSDKDIFVVSYNSDRLSLFENLGGGLFSDPKIILKGIDGASKVRVADLDLDADLDFVVYSSAQRKIDRIENLGNGTFSSLESIDGYANVTDMTVADIDNDNYPDLVTSISGAVYLNMTPDKVGWYKNLGNGTFGTLQLLTDSIDGPRGVLAADIDNDLDMDLLVAGHDDDRIYWFENNGGSLGAQQVFADSLNNVARVFSTDLDHDGDVDIISDGNAHLYWFENLGGGTFAPLVISTLEISDMDIADINVDSASDILVANDLGVYLENDGTTQFDSIQSFGQIPGMSYLLASDADEDGDEDVFTLWTNANRLSWFENTTLNVGVAEHFEPQINLYPNPTTGQAVIKTNEPTQLTIYNALGELVVTKRCNGWASIHLEDHPNGVYLVNLETSAGIITKKLIKMK
ncbi:MAG: T9SS type A sorting domain-containing protein [Flavobacteriales bacterium]|nr:T9SS type A sorting domain-containing protein [Flavobacteriales bacterium]